MSGSSGAGNDDGGCANWSMATVPSFAAGDVQDVGIGTPLLTSINVDEHTSMQSADFSNGQHSKH